MAEAFLAYPELRHPFDATPIHPSGSATILYDGKKVTLSDIEIDDDLWIKSTDLSRVNGFELKPEGACFDEVCIPISDAMTRESDGTSRFNLTAFAEHVGQTYVADLESRVWSFAEIPARRDNMMLNAMAPDFELTDRQGTVIRLADLKGKKALIVTWSSW